MIKRQREMARKCYNQNLDELKAKNEWGERTKKKNKEIAKRKKEKKKKFW